MRFSIAVFLIECERLSADKTSDLLCRSLRIALLIVIRRNCLRLFASYMNNDKSMLTYQYNVFEILVTWMPCVGNQAHRKHFLVYLKQMFCHQVYLIGLVPFVQLLQHAVCFHQNLLNHRLWRQMPRLLQRPFV